jgi:(p)ppGpp synthase/HD superfamily hydrolase
MKLESNTKVFGNFEFDKVWELTSKIHEGQRYGGYQEGEFTDYLDHIQSVTFEVMTATLFEHQLNANLAVKCAMLHDALEDSHLTYSDIKNEFGTEVANGVAALTKDAKIKGRKMKVIDSLERIKDQPYEVWAVKLADRLANLQYPPFFWDNKKKKDYLAESQIIYDYLQEGCPFLAQKLHKKMIEYQRFIKRSSKVLLK